MLSHFTAPFTEISPSEWDRCVGPIVESHGYYCACEASNPDHVEHQAMVVCGEAGIVAVAPRFRMSFDLRTPFQSGPLAAGLAGLSRLAPNLLRLPLIGLGSPFAEQAHLGLAPDLTPERKRDVAGRLLDGLESEAQRHDVGLLVIKDIRKSDLHAFLPHLRARGYVRLASLPTAVLHLPFSSEEAYLASLSAETRKDIRRKLRRATDVEIEVRTDISDVAHEIYALYEETRAGSTTDYGDFERLPPSYFTSVMAAIAPRALCVLYRVSGVLAAFNLLLLEDDRVIDKFLGMRYPLAREANLYFVSWMHNVRYCIANGKSLLQTGQGTFANKLRLGSALEPLDIYFRHRRRPVHQALRVAAAMFDFERLDPDLRTYRRHLAEKQSLACGASCGR